MKVDFEASFGEWTHRDSNHFKLISAHKFFRDTIIQARKKMKLKQDNLPKNFATAELYELSDHPAQLIVDRYDLPVKWKEPLRFFIVTGKMRSPGAEIIRSGYSKRANLVREEMFVHQDSFSINVYENIGYTNLAKYIKVNRKEIEKSLNDLPRRRSLKKNLEISIDIVKLLDQGKKIPEILDRLTHKYGDKAPLEVNLRMMIKRINSALNGAEIK